MRSGGTERFDPGGLMRIMREALDGPADLINRLRDRLRSHLPAKSAPDDRTLVGALVLWGTSPMMNQHDLIGVA